MSSLEKFYELTLKLVQALERNFDRDEKIILVEQLLAERELNLGNISPPEPGEGELAERLIQLNQKLDMLLIKEKTLIQKDLMGLKQRKENSDKYQNPYASVSVDGMFYDKRN